MLDRDNIAMVVMLTPKSKPRNCSTHDSGGQICIANTHLLFNPGRGDIKLAQLRILLAEVDKIAFRGLSQTHKPLYHPVIICGDLNSEPNCDLYKFIDTGALRYEGLVAGDISGQAEGSFRGRFSLSRELVPQTLGISDQCQYMETFSHRMGLRSKPNRDTNCINASASRNDESNVTQDAMDKYKSQIMEKASHVEEVSKDGGGTMAVPDERYGQQQKLTPRFSSGMMTHRLNLESAYDHHLRRLGNTPAVTTHHRNGSCTVDYIFYSLQTKRVRYHRRKVTDRYVEEGKLSLLATYSLLSDRELRDMGGLPNISLPSDHLPLIAKFVFLDS